MTDLESIPTRELCDSLSELATAITEKRGTYPEDAETVLQAARRLSRFAWIPVYERLPEKSDATDKDQVLVKWANGTISVHQWDSQWRRAANGSLGTAVAWSRINNET